MKIGKTRTGARAKRPAPETQASAEALLHELRLRQAELEAQNRALQRAQAELLESRDRYQELYEFAPIGYFTLTPEAAISEVNLTGTALLGQERRKLLGRRFDQFVAPENAGHWQKHFMNTLEAGGAHGCELVLVRGGGTRFQAGLDCMCIKQDREPATVKVVLTDITERKRIEAELHEYHELMRELASLTVAAREAEYKHIAREVHDELGQLLTAVRMEVSLLRIQFGERDPAMMEKIREILALVDKAIRGARNVTANLRPAALDMGIVPALGWLCDNFPGRASTACTVRIADKPEGLDDARTVAIFRIVQESLTNAARYAEANSVEIVVGKEGGDVVVDVRDDGKGFDPAALLAKKSFGLMGMRERALAVGGKVEIASAPARGTVVSVRIPVKHKRSVS